MDWQQVVSLLIVAGAAGLLAAGKLRQRRRLFGQHAGCSCAGAPRSSTPPAITFRARKGHRPEILVKAR